MSAREKADQLIQLLAQAEHAQQGLSLLHALDDDDVKRLVARSIDFGVHSIWRARTLDLEILSTCSRALLEEFALRLEGLGITDHHCLIPGVERVLHHAHSLSIDVRSDPVSVVLPALPKLRSFDSLRAHIDLGGLGAAADLESLSAVEGKVLNATLDWLKTRALTTLKLHRATQLRELGPLATQPQLLQLEITHAPIEDVSPLGALETLRSLCLIGCTEIRSLKPLAGLSELRVLALAGTKFSPDDVPNSIRPYATWTPSPDLHRLAQRPRYPG